MNDVQSLIDLARAAKSAPQRRRQPRFASSPRQPTSHTVLHLGAFPALGCLGFEGGGPHHNFSRDHLPHDARKLACMTELLFGAAYGDGVCDMLPMIRTRAAREADARPEQLEFDA